MSFYTSLTGINSALNRLDVTSNNISNAQTDTFKKSNISFQDIYSSRPQQLKSVEVGQGSSVASISQQFTQGSLVATGKTLDVAISGDGFYVMQDRNNQKFYSRMGQFSVNENDYVVNEDGEMLMGVKGVAVPNATSYTLDPVNIPKQTTGQFKPTTEINFEANLPAQAEIINKPFDPNDKNTYNASNIIAVYDSTGKPHNATSYYVKKTNPTESYPYTEWVTHLYIDGKKVDQPPKNPAVIEGDNYIEWTGEGFNSGDFIWPPVSEPGVGKDEITIVDGKVYQGNGTSAEVIGTVDPIKDGKSGNSLRINYLDKVKPLNQVLENGVELNMTSGLKPIGFIPAGSENIKIKIDSYSWDDDIQLFTGAGKHLLGTPILGDNADPTWINNAVNSVEDVNSKVVKDEYGFLLDAEYDGEFPILQSPDLTPYITDASSGVSKTFNGMSIKYTGDGDRSVDDSGPNDGNVENSHEMVAIDKTTEPVFLMVSGQGVFNVKVSWDKMPEIPGIEINKAGIKNIINYTGAADEIKFPITGKNVVTGNPQYFTRVDFPDGSYINDIRMNYDSTTGYGGSYEAINVSQDGRPEGELSNVDISRDGIVSASYTNGHTEKLSTLMLARFNNAAGLRQSGDTKYKETTAAGVALVNRAGYGGAGLLQTGAIEQSNVDVTVELVDLIEAQRNFQSNSKAIEATDRMKKAMLDNLS
jgi:flagellar hook-basal body protein